MLKEQERRLTAELLALRLRDLDSGAQVQDSAMRECELAMQSALADLRSAEASIETQRTFHAEQSDAVGQVQGRFYAVGADISRTEQQIQYARDTRERKRTDLGQSRVSLEALANQVARDEQELQAIREANGLTHDVLRHTAATARINLPGASFAQVALDFDNSEKMLRDHYLGVWEDEATVLFYAIMPTKFATWRATG